jgi:hypothetical protein
VRSTAEDVARWMLRELCAHGVLPQKAAALEIRDRFGQHFLAAERRGGLAIAPEVLGAFRQLSEGTAVWDRRKRSWRVREQDDPPGRRQAGR